VVKASLTGSIIGNLLLVLGGSILAGGLKFKRQSFNVVGARAQSTLLTLVAIAFIMPAAFHHLAGPGGRGREHDLSLTIALVLLAIYALHLVFSLVTRKQLFAGEPAEPAPEEKPWSVARSVGALAASTAVLAWLSEILVGSVEPRRRSE
jgi:Ca2+:H+ antiporter